MHHDRELARRLLVEHEARRDRTGAPIAACCVFADEIEALRAELAETQRRAWDLVSSISLMAALGWSSDVMANASRLSELLPVPKASGDVS